MANPVRKYTYYDYTISLCPTCLKRIGAKIVFEKENVYMIKKCPEHGTHKVLLATDIDYYKNIRNYNKASEMPLKFNTPIEYGCPYDCGLCTDHEQHSCLSIIEITDRCNLTCPTCYAMSSPHYGNHRTVEEVEKMLNIMVENEGEPDVLQISGGEPTIHPEFFKILDIAKSKPIKHLMLNTNGIRIAQDPGFAEKLATYMPDFEIYLQFDSFKPEVLQKMRGKDLTEVREKALDKLNELNLSTTLVVTMEKGLNDDEAGKIIDFALKQKCVRGVTFQPVQIAGRNTPESLKNRLTLTEVRNNILTQTDVFQPNDIIPVPCNPDALAMGYVLKLGGEKFPLTRYIDPKELLNTETQNTIIYEQSEVMRDKLIKIFSTGISVDKAEGEFNQLLCCLPQISAPGLKYDHLFRIIIMNFMDAYDFDVRAVKKSCVHIVNKDGKIIPFENMNLFYRDEKKEYLEELRKKASLTF
ncbi:radical SAM protein [Apibacter muscae]|uniref:Radical SAM protein n=1 Tax=Apibacter muscae TaxID=2509004 RepID=A0A563DKU7_9FLAO|nr:radical SAM protein [Apibacter muscae]TWP30642.1 radical SAM protein [Apibacter muscae]